jgi:hypothetical protein
MKKFMLSLILALPLIANAATVWTENEAKANAASVVKRIAQGEKDLRTAIETDDADGLNRYITAPFAKMLRSWSEQRRELNNLQAEKYAACHDAAFEFQFYSLSFTKRDSIDTRRDRDQRKSSYLRNLADCKKLLATQ